MTLWTILVRQFYLNEVTRAKRDIVPFDERDDGPFRNFYIGRLGHE